MEFIREFMSAFITILYVAIFVRVIMDWLIVARVMQSNNPLRYLLIRITEPILAPLRRYARIGMMDLSPVAAIIILMFIQRALAGA